MTATTYLFIYKTKKVVFHFIHQVLKQNNVNLRPRKGVNTILGKVN